MGFLWRFLIYMITKFMKLSIITICYNAERVIEKTIQSVLAQKFKNFEFIIIDGKSTDNTLSIIEKYKSKIDILVSEKDLGIFNAQNKGILKASGEYLFFLNAGDCFFEPETLERVFSNSSSEDIIYGDIVNDWGKDDNYWKQKGLQFRGYPDVIDYKYWFHDFLCHQVTFIKKSLFDRYGLYDETYKYAADHDFFYRVWFKKEISKKHIPVIITLYEMSGVSIQLENRIKVLQEINSAQRKNISLYFLKKMWFNGFIYKLVNVLRMQSLHLLCIFLRIFLSQKHFEHSFWGVDNGEIKILSINSTDYGGAARAVYRIHESLLQHGVLSRFLVMDKLLSDSNIKVATKKNGVWRILNRLRIREIKKYQSRFNTKNTIIHSLSYVSDYDLITQIKKINPDIVHLHWVQFDFLTIEDIQKINKPIVWTLHDMWPICGAEHYSFDERFKQGYLDGNRPEGESGFDLNKWVWERKVKAWSHIKKITPVGVSNWMGDCIRESILFNKYKSYVISNGLDSTTFKPHDKFHSRKLFSLAPDKKIILFGASNFNGDERKGFKFFCDALKIISKSLIAKNLEVVVFGSDSFVELEEISIKQHSLGRLTNDTLLIKAYSCADVMVVPSLIESFGQTASEAMACGTPVVCFDTSGLKDIVDHKINGYKAKCYSAEDLADGITWVLEDGDIYKKLSDSARRKTLDNFTYEKLAENYSKVYRNILLA